MGEEDGLNFIFIGLGEVWTSCLHTLLRDQTPCGSFLEKIFVGQFVFNFENGFEEEKRGLKGMRLKKVRLFQLLKKKVKVGI